MAPQPPAVADESAAILKGQIHRYPVTQPDGNTKCQLVLITSAPDENGAVRGVPLGYEDDAALFQPHQFA